MRVCAFDDLLTKVVALVESLRDSNIRYRGRVK